MNDPYNNHSIELHIRPIDDIKWARNLIYANPELIRKYPSLEDALKLLVKVIELEEN